MSTKRTRGDCTVRALSKVAKITYALAESIAADGGRRPGQGAHSHDVIRAAKARGLSFRKLRCRSKTVARFIREHPVGRYYVRKRQHAFAVVNGVISDAGARR